MNYQIVSDSSSNLFALEGASYTTVPMKLNAGEREFVDTPALDLQEMVTFLKSYKGKSGSSCPNAQEWLDAYGDAQRVYAITISKNLSGSYNAAQNAVLEYEQEHPGRRAVVLDSLSAGPQLAMVAEKIAQLEAQGLPFDEVVAQVRQFQNHLHTTFCLESLTNLARNGRVNPAVAKVAGVLGIRLVGAAIGGKIEPIYKSRGAKKAVQNLLDLMDQRGFQDGNQLRVAHCFGAGEAQTYIDAVLQRYPNTKVTLEATGALCSFYAEVGGLMIAFEGGYNAENDCTKF